MKDKTITLAHGAGSSKSRQLIEEVFLPRFGNPELSRLSDAASFDLEKTRHAFTTDTHVIDPIFFSGGDIGKLAVCGSVNDLVVCGAKPLYMSCGLILEEGLAISDLERIADSMANTANAADVKIVTGDTKVVGPGQADKIYINTSAIGRVVNDYAPKSVEPDQKIIVTGPVGQHGSAIFNDREKLLDNSDLVSDCASLDWMLPAIERFADSIVIMRDPTRGGLAVILNELLAGSSCGMEIIEEKLPLTPATQSLCELVGFDPFYLPCEGRAVIVTKPNAADDLLSALKSCQPGQGSTLIGSVTSDSRNRLCVSTTLGGSRILPATAELMLPRIC